MNFYGGKIGCNFLLKGQRDIMNLGTLEDIAGSETIFGAIKANKLHYGQYCLAKEDDNTIFLYQINDKLIPQKIAIIAEDDIDSVYKIYNSFNSVPAGNEDIQIFGFNYTPFYPSNSYSPIINVNKTFKTAIGQTQIYQNGVTTDEYTYSNGNYYLRDSFVTPPNGIDQSNYYHIADIEGDNNIILAGNCVALQENAPSLFINGVQATPGRAYIFFKHYMAQMPLQNFGFAQWLWVGNYYNSDDNTTFHRYVHRLTIMTQQPDKSWFKPDSFDYNFLEFVDSYQPETHSENKYFSRRQNLWVTGADGTTKTLFNIYPNEGVITPPLGDFSSMTELFSKQFSIQTVAIT